MPQIIPYHLLTDPIFAVSIKIFISSYPPTSYIDTVSPTCLLYISTYFVPSISYLHSYFTNCQLLTRITCPVTANFSSVIVPPTASKILGYLVILQCASSHLIVCKDAAILAPSSSINRIKPHAAYPRLRQRSMALGKTMQHRATGSSRGSARSATFSDSPYLYLPFVFRMERNRCTGRPVKHECQYPLARVAHGSGRN